jgi:hypothetical protein
VTALNRDVIGPLATGLHNEAPKGNATCVLDIIGSLGYHQGLKPVMAGLGISGRPEASAGFDSLTRLSTFRKTCGSAIPGWYPERCPFVGAGATGRVSRLCQAVPYLQWASIF